jgi:hypothetical protein
MQAAFVEIDVALDPTQNHYLIELNQSKIFDKSSMKIVI